VSLIIQGVPSQIANLVQDRTLERVFHDSLYPRLVFRGEANPEVWLANIGERAVLTRAGLIPVDIDPLVPGQDPTVGEYATEQWEVEARQYGKTIPTNMPSSYVAIASLFLRNTASLGLHAAQTLDRLARNALFVPYLSGEAMLTAAGVATATSIQVDTLNGFTQALQNGRLSAVSASNPLAITFSGGVEPANTVIGFVPSNPLFPLGPGVLLLGTGLTGTPAARTAVLSAARARRLRIGAGATVDALTSANILTLNDVIQAVARLRSANVPPHPDGTYHVHLDPTAESQIFQDNHWQRLHQSGSGGEQYRDFVIGTCVGCTFFRNTQMPEQSTVVRTQAVAGGAGGAIMAQELGGEIVNANGVAIRRTLVTGGGAIIEKYLDESKFVTEAGVNGRIGEFSLINGGVTVMAQRIRYILRAPQDKLQQVVDQTWSWSGDFGVPSDALSGDSARFKRAVVIEGA